MDDSQYSSCLWCSDTLFMQSHLYDFIRPPSRKKDRPPWLEQAETDLCSCVDCMEEYHRLVQEAYESDSRFLDMKEQVYRTDTNRLEKYMKRVLQEHADGFDDDVDSIPMTQKTAQLQASLKAPVREVLKYPRLLLSESVSDQFVQVFYALTRVNESLEIEEKFPGIYLLLVFPDYQVRRWALNTVKSLGSLDWDDYDELEEVIKWLVTVITFNLFVDPIQDVGSAAWKDEECVQLPKHLYTYSSPKDYWLGICSLVTAMDAECIRSRLMSSTSGHQQLIDAIINALIFQSDKNYAHHGRRKASYNTSRLTSDKADSTVFWPAMQCLVILLDRLQFRFWSFTTQSAENVAKSILGNPYYHLELRRWSLNGKDEEEINSSEVESEVSISEVEDDWVSNSQLVYSWGNGKMFGQTRSSQVAQHSSEVCSPEIPRTAAFSWKFFLVQSLLDFGDIMSDTVEIILQAIHSIYQLAMAGKKSFEFFHLTSNPGTENILPSIPKLSESALCNESLLTLSRLAELLFNNSGYMLLLKFQSLWLSDVTEAVYALLQTSISGQSYKGGMQRGLRAITPLPSSLTHIVKFARSILTSPIAVEFSKSKNILSALSTSPSVKASIPKYQRSSKHSLQGVTTSDSLLNCPGISKHFLLVLKKCQSVHDSSSPYLLLTETTSFQKPESPITPPLAETSSVIPDPLHKTIAYSDSLDTDVTPNITSQEEDEAVLGLSLQVQGQSSRVQDQLETSDSSDAEICSTPLKRRPRPRSKRSNTTLARKQLNLLSEDTTDTDDFESQRVFSRHRAIPVPTKQKQLSPKKRNVKASPGSTPEKTLGSTPDVTKTRDEVSKYRAKSYKSQMQYTTTVQSESKSGSGKQKAKVQPLPSKKAKSPLQPVRSCGLRKSPVKTLAPSRKGRIKTSRFDTTSEDDCGSSTETLSSDDVTTTDSSLQAARKFGKTKLSQFPKRKGERVKQLSNSKEQANEEIIVISSDDSSTTEPLSPISSDVSTGWCNQGEVHSTVNSLKTVTHWLEGPSHSLPQNKEESESHSKHSENAKHLSHFSKHLDAKRDTHCIFQDLTAEAQDEDSGDHSDSSSATSTSGALLHVATIKHSDSKSSIPAKSSVHETMEVSNTMHQTPPVLKASHHTVSPPILKACRVDLYRIPTKGIKCSVDKLKEPAAKKLCHRQAAITVPHQHNARADIQKKVIVDLVHVSHAETPINQQGPRMKERKEGDRTATSVDQLLLLLSPSKMAVSRDIEIPTVSEASTSEPFVDVKSKKPDIQVTTQSSVQASLDPITKMLPSAIAKHDQVSLSKPNRSFLQTEKASETCTGPEPIPVSEIINDIPITIQHHTPNTSVKGNTTPSNSRIGHKPCNQSEDRRSEPTTLQLTSLTASEKHVPIKRTISGSVTQTDLTTNWKSTVPSVFKKPTEKRKGSSQSDVFSKPSEPIPPLKKVKFADTPKSSGMQLTCRQTASTTSYDSHRNTSFTKAGSSTQTSVIRNITMQTPDFMKPSTLPTKRPIMINIRPTLQRKMDDLFLVILSWDPARFLFPPESTDGRPIKPDLLLPEEPAAVPSVFQSYDQYCNIFTPLLHLEIWENLYQAIQDKSIQKPPICRAKVSSITGTEQPLFQLMKCSSVVSHRDARENAYPLERDLVVIDFQNLLEFACVLPMGGVESNLNMRHRFALVESVSRSFKMPEKETLGGSSVREITFLLKVLSLGVESVHSIEGRSIEINVITSLTPTIRQWNGLINLHHSQLVRDILHPRGGIYFGLNPTQEKAPREHSPLYNASQFEAIQAAAKATCEAYAKPRICLLQGPPGTGKTHTISGMIQFFFETVKPQQSGRSALPGQSSSRIQPSKPHILVCSPSNAGVDEIARRLINDGLVIGTDKWTRKYGNKDLTKGATENQNPGSTRKCSQLPGFNVIRVGREQKVHPDVRSISLDEMARKKLAKDLNALQSLPADKIKKKITDLQQEIDKLERQRGMLRHSRNSSDSRSEILKVEAELDKKMEKRIQLIRQHKLEKFKRHNSQKEETVVRRKLLMNADVVCATLVGSGSSAIMECLKHNPLHFTCVIVDEASQCCELDVLIPLRYLSTKLILVGDPLQLPATIKSHKALSLGFGKSLFERLYTHFMNASENPIKMLQVQYRMLPEICKFPSTHFYQGKLKTHCCDQANTLTRLKPLQMFDVVQGQECKRSSSICNMEECRLVTGICQVLLDSEEVNPSGIGVITPYKSQEREIKDCLHKQIKGYSSRAIDVGTVDSFQGREKDVIILSCVRARSRTGSIGFLSSRQRMNVALTRSKRGLYILGHFNSLLVNEDWKALIQHGENSNVIVTLDRSRSYTTAASAVLRPKGAPVNVLQSAQTSDTGPVGSKHSVAVTSHSSDGEVSLNKYPKRAAESSNAQSSPQAKRRKETTDSERYSLPILQHSSTARATCTFSSTNPPLSKKTKNNISSELPVQSTSLKSLSLQPFQDTCAVEPLRTKVPDSDSSETSDSDQSQSTTAPCLDRATASHTSSDLQGPQELNYAATFPTPPRNCPPTCDRTWRPHGGPRERVAHKSQSTIIRHRSKSLTEEETGGSPKKSPKKSSIIEKMKKSRL